MQVGTAEAQRGQIGQGFRGRRSEMTGVASHRVGRQLEGVQFLPPGAQVGGEHAVRPPLLRQHFVALEQYLVLVVTEGNSLRLQSERHLLVAGDGIRLIIAVGEYFAYPQLDRQADDAVDRGAVADDQSAPLRAIFQRQLLQAPVQFMHAVEDEFDPPIATGRQCIEDVGVKNEGAEHP